MASDKATALLYLLPILLIGVIHAFYRWNIYRKIKNTGVVGYGRLISCEGTFIPKALAVKYNPVIEFYYAEQRYEILAMGTFSTPPSEVGDEIAILFLEKYPKSVVIRDRDMQPGYIFWILFYLALCASILLYYGHSLWLYSMGYPS